MRKVLTLAATLVAVVGCECGKPVLPGDDGGFDAGTPCVLESDCAFGEACVEGYCSLPVTPDAGITCTRHEDCPQGQLCLPSTGQCFTPPDTDSGEEDGGLITGVCNPGDSQSCGSSKLGVCKLGTAACEVVNGAYAFGACTGNVEPAAEACNGLDDDCDGLIDDGFADIGCGTGECRRSVPGCVNGAVNTCTAGSASAEVCDAKDNDCDGFADNLPDIGCGTGACRRTAGACDAGVPGVCSPGTAGTESCNGLDDDCNSATDDGFAMVNCGVGICFNSVYPCADGGTVTCQPLVGLATENCNNALDDDCNGLINDTCACTTGQTQPCYSGPPLTQFVPPCMAGLQTCVDGGWAACVGQVVPQTESCNNVDDNCDNAIDNLGQTSCGQGVCFRTVQNCVAGAPQTCREGDAGVELCNNLDDNCDGTVDNGIPDLTCGIGACFRSVPACTAGGGNNTCVQGAPTTETCNGVDEDCTGTADDNLPDAGCSTGQPGICAAGREVCNSGIPSCQRINNPVTELCNNGLDDDCNGTADISPLCCNPAINRDSDPANECNDCNDTDGTIYPTATERCNGKDDNCNGQIDEGFDKDLDTFTLCGTMDGGGIDVRRIDCNDDAGFVFPLKVFDCGNAATLDAGNGVDDNCNGYADETCSPCTPDGDGDGRRRCDGDCNDADPAVYPGAIEVCDGKDNDCNRLTVDNCGVSQNCGRPTSNNPNDPWVRWDAGSDECRPELVCVISVATGALTCGSYCNQTSGLGLNDSCSTNQACDRILIDSTKQNLCSQYPAWNGNTAVGGTCSAETDCAQHNCRADGAVNYCTDNCNHETACPPTTSCAVQSLPTVRVGPTQYYAYIAQCRRDGLLPAGAQGANCASDTACQSGVCFQGKCAMPCCAHSDCAASGTACGLGPSQAIGYVSGSTRLMSTVPVCRSTGGTRPSGAACTANSDCRSRMCDALQGVCVDLCCNDSSCTTPGQTCEPLPLVIPDGGVVDVMRGCVFSPVPSRIQMRPVP